MGLTQSSLRSTHAEQLMDSLAKLREEGQFCNFTIKVGEESFMVDKNIMAASSPYFKALFSSTMEETETGVVDMKEVDAGAMQACLVFIYTGEAILRMNIIHHILHAANLLQLQCLLDLCFEHMNDNLTPHNCVQVMMLSDTYSNESLKKDAFEVLTANLEEVIDSNTFSHLHKRDLLQCLRDSEADHQTLWNAAVCWVKNRNQETEDSLFDIFVKCGFETFPIKFLFEEVLEEPRVKNDVKFVKFVIDVIFRDDRMLEQEIGDDVEKCFKLQNSLQVLEKVADANESISIDFFAKNAVNVFDRREFYDLSSSFVGKILQKGNCSEELKYEALLRWTKHDREIRKIHFPGLFKFIKLDTFSLDFLKQKVQSEILVKKSPECYEILMDVLFIFAGKNSSEMPSLSSKMPSSSSEMLSSSLEIPSSNLEMLSLSAETPPSTAEMPL